MCYACYERLAREQGQEVEIPTEVQGLDELDLEVPQVIGADFTLVELNENYVKIAEDSERR